MPDYTFGPEHHMQPYLQRGVQCGTLLYALLFLLCVSLPTFLEERT
jgi:hypothetical protein